MRTQTACRHTRFAFVVNHVYRPAAVEGARAHLNPCFCALRGHGAAWGWRPRRSRGVRYMRCAECGVLPDTNGARGVSRKRGRFVVERTAAVRGRERRCGCVGVRRSGWCPAYRGTAGELCEYGGSWGRMLRSYDYGVQSNAKASLLYLFRETPDMDGFDGRSHGVGC